MPALLVCIAFLFMEELAMVFPKVNPPKIALAYLVIAGGLHMLFPKAILSCGWAGGICFLAGLIIMVSAWRLFAAHRTPVRPYEVPTALITGGPYRFTRNPMYVGITLILLGVALMVGSWPLFIAPAGFCITIDRTFIPYEEEKMTRLFGLAYEDYKKRVRRWI